MISEPKDEPHAGTKKVRLCCRNCGVVVSGSPSKFKHDIKCPACGETSAFVPYGTTPPRHVLSKQTVLRYVLPAGLCLLAFQMMLLWRFCCQTPVDGSSQMLQQQHLPPPGEESRMPSLLQRGRHESQSQAMQTEKETPATPSPDPMSDLVVLANKARPAVMLILVMDANDREVCRGTGFLVSADGKLITNHHVTENGHSAIAKADTGGRFSVVGILADDPKNDLAVLRLEGSNLPTLPLGSATEVKVGERVAVIGSPLGLEGTLPEGVISSIRDPSVLGQPLIQITAALSPGSSGSPVLNRDGACIGVATLARRGGQYINFAVPVEYAKALLAQADKVGEPQTLASRALRDEEKIHSDHDWKSALAAQDAGRYAEMLVYARAIAGRYPEHHEAYFLLGIACSYNQRFSDAIIAHQKAIELKPDYALAWCNLGGALSQASRNNEAIYAYRHALELQPNDANTWEFLGKAYRRLERNRDAIAAYEKALSLAEHEIAAMPEDKQKVPRLMVTLMCMSLGDIYRDVKDCENSIKAFEKAINMTPTWADAWYALGLTLIDNGQDERAREVWKRLWMLDQTKAAKLEPLLR